MNPPRSETLARERGQVTNLAGTTAKGDEPDLVILGGWGRNATGKDRQRDRERAKTDRGPIPRYGRKRTDAPTDRQTSIDACMQAGRQANRDRH